MPPYAQKFTSLGTKNMVRLKYGISQPLQHLLWRLEWSYCFSVFFTFFQFSSSRFLSHFFPPCFLGIVSFSFWSFFLYLPFPPVCFLFLILLLLLCILIFPLHPLLLFLLFPVILLISFLLRSCFFSSYPLSSFLSFSLCFVFLDFTFSILFRYYIFFSFFPSYILCFSLFFLFIHVLFFPPLLPLSHFCSPLPASFSFSFISLYLFLPYLSFPSLFFLLFHIFCFLFLTHCLSLSSHYLFPSSPYFPWFPLS